jgi:hypothetical protein
MELSIIPTNSSAFAGLSRYEKEIAQAQGAIRISTLNDSDLMNVALRAISLSKIKLGSKPLPEEEQKALTLVLMEDIASFGHLTLDEINLALKRGLNGEYNSAGNDVIFFSPSNFCGWVRKFIEQKNEVMRKVANAKVVEPAKPIPSDSDLKMAAINSANMYAQEMMRCQERSIKMNWIAGGLHVLYDYIVQFGIYEASAEDKKRIYTTLLPKYQDKDQLIMACKAQCYREFIENLADFKAYLTETGEIKPCE